MKTWAEIFQFIDAAVQDALLAHEITPRDRQASPAEMTASMCRYHLDLLQWQSQLLTKIESFVLTHNWPTTPGLCVDSDVRH